MTGKDTKNTMKKAVEAIASHIDNNTNIGYKLVVLYGLANAMQTMANSIDMEIRSIYRSVGIPNVTHGMGEGELMGLKMYNQNIRGAVHWFFKEIERKTQFIAYGEDDKVNAHAYDKIAEDANELCQLILAYVDRTKLEENADLLELIKSRKEGGIFTQHDIEKFKLG